MTHLTDHLTKLTCAAGTARDLGYVHTCRALDRMIAEEKARLKATMRPGGAFASPAARES
ncbi:hypothetical protein [Gymnodinialimonas sp.]